MLWLFCVSLYSQRIRQNENMTTGGRENILLRVLTMYGRHAANADRCGPSRTASLKVSLCAFRPKRVPTLVLAHDRLFPPLAAAEV